MEERRATQAPKPGSRAATLRAPGACRPPRGSCSRVHRRFPSHLENPVKCAVGWVSLPNQRLLDIAKDPGFWDIDRATSVPEYLGAQASSPG
jgi:hypothetical protein